jgi:hypothetical protein
MIYWPHRRNDPSHRTVGLVVDLVQRYFRRRVEAYPPSSRLADDH